MKIELMVLNFGDLSEEKRFKNEKKSKREKRMRVGLGVVVPLFGGEGQENSFGGGWVVE